MYFPNRTWLENGPARRRCGSGLGETVTLSTLDQAAFNPTWQGSVTNTLGSSSVNVAFPFVTGSGGCNFLDPSNPNCLSADALAAGPAAGSSVPSPAAPATIAGMPVWLTVGVVGFIAVLGLVKR